MTMEKLNTVSEMMLVMSVPRISGRYPPLPPDGSMFRQA